MRDYGKVYSSFWSSPTTSSFSDTGRLLALYLLTCSHSTIAGVFRLPDGYIAEDLQWSIERVREGFRELSAKGFAKRCETTKWVWVVEHLKWNNLDNPNQKTSARKIAMSVPRECAWGPDFSRSAREVLTLPERTDWNHSGTVGEGLANLNLKLELNQQLKQEHLPPPGEPAGAEVDAGAARPQEIDPQPEVKSGPKKTVVTWEAYREAFAARYGTDPIRNKVVNSQLSAFVDRVGAGPAPEIAAFYLTHSDPRFVREKHSIGLLLNQAERLHADWQTNTTAGPVAGARPRFTSEDYQRATDAGIRFLEDRDRTIDMGN